MGPGDACDQVHRHQQQAGPRALPDADGAPEVHGPAQEGPGEGGEVKGEVRHFSKDALISACDKPSPFYTLFLLSLSPSFFLPLQLRCLQRKKKKVRVGRAGRAGGGVVPGPLAVRRKSTRPNPKAQKTQKKQKQKKAFQK